MHPRGEPERDAASVRPHVRMNQNVMLLAFARMCTCTRT
jgi:hypothetical protein